ncbi:MAG TPA: DNA-binding protein [Candidatus Choladousia intestinavium]|uniref:UPF0122 protein IAB31_11240 n=1 Tax=Candidatus Choladousia intestinavium TaxID=2840727 RepID=A0A9D1ADY9_9FIRM|nr:DNA-binding protein [Candidatus Choladousia intestinavium]
MEQILQQTLLYDFYGELLTEHQQNVYEQVVLNDLSYSEAASELGISRQGVHELIKRCNKILESYEARLHLVERFLGIRENVRKIQELSVRWKEKSGEEPAGQIYLIAERILEEL